MAYVPLVFQFAFEIGHISKVSHENKQIVQFLRYLQLKIAVM